LRNFLILCYLPPPIFNNPPSGPDLKQHFAHLVSPQILVIKYFLVSGINLVRAARVDVSELQRCMEPNCHWQVGEEGAKILFMFQIMCQIHFICEILHCHICTVRSGL